MRGRVLRDTYDWEGDEPLHVPLNEAVIYEMHVGAFTADPASATAAVTLAAYPNPDGLPLRDVIARVWGSAAAGATLTIYVNDDPVAARFGDTVAAALLAAGIIGVFIARDATFSAEVGGCQAECGAGSGMAAAGLVMT